MLQAATATLHISQSISSYHHHHSVFPSLLSTHPAPIAHRRKQSTQLKLLAGRRVRVPGARTPHGANNGLGVLTPRGGR